MGIVLDIEHKTEQFGASYDTDYEVITRCAPDCPACSARAQLKKVVEWINTPCEEHYDGGKNPPVPRRKCYNCLLALWKEAGIE